MVKRLGVCVAAFALAAGMSLAAARSKAAAKAGTWTGLVTDEMCGAKHARAADHGAECTKKCEKMGTKLALYVPATKGVYVLDPQDKAVGHEGETVTVKGTLDASTKTIHVSSLMARASRKTTAKPAASSDKSM